MPTKISVFRYDCYFAEAFLIATLMIHQHGEGIDGCRLGCGARGPAAELGDKMPKPRKPEMLLGKYKNVCNVIKNIDKLFIFQQ